MIPAYAILMLGLISYATFFHTQISPYYSVDNLRKTCCGSLFQVCQVSGSSYYYFKYRNPKFDELLKIESLSPFQVYTELFTLENCQSYLIYL